VRGPSSKKTRLSRALFPSQEIADCVEFLARSDTRVGVMKPFGLFIRHSPRTASALAFGIVTLAVQHFAWLPHARVSGLAPALTIAAGLAHAVAGAITGPRLMDGIRTRTPSQAGLLGAGTSLLALMLFAPLFTVFLFATGLHPAGALSYVVLPFLVAVFALLADGWALILVSMGVGWALYRIALNQPTV
jgi:hypothetical protein